MSSALSSHLGSAEPPSSKHEFAGTPTATRGGGDGGDNAPKGKDDEYEWVEDKDKDDGAVYPIQGSSVPDSTIAPTYSSHPPTLCLLPTWLLPTYSLPLPPLLILPP